MLRGVERGRHGRAFVTGIELGVDRAAPEGWPEAGTFVGREAVHATVRATCARRWDDRLEVTVSDFIDAGDRVVAIVHWRGAGHGPEIERRSSTRRLYGARRQGRLTSSTSGITPKPSKPWGCRSRRCRRRTWRSPQGFENLRRGVEAWNREDLDAFLETWHPDCEWRPAFPEASKGLGPCIGAAKASPERGKVSVASGTCTGST